MSYRLGKCGVRTAKSAADAIRRMLFVLISALLIGNIAELRLGESQRIPENKTSTANKAISNVAMDNPLKLSPKHSGLSTSADPELRKLSEYEDVCGGSITTHMLVFTELSATPIDALKDASDFANTLKEFARFSIEPIVIFEPTIHGQPINLKSYRRGEYDQMLDAYFNALKAQGLSSDVLGTWVFMPEGNTPRWLDTDPGDYGANVALTAVYFKKYFPTADISILLDSKTYQSNDADWAYGSYKSLLPYVESLPAGLLSSVGIQGFPWAPPAGDASVPINDPTTFLPVSLAEALARKAGVTKIWFNTGTFARYYTQDKSQAVVYSLTERAKILNGIAAIAKQTKKDGFQVSVSLFAADKSTQDEAIDWSYWHSLAPNTSSGQTLLREFVQRLDADGVSFWLFDSETP